MYIAGTFCFQAAGDFPLVFVLRLAIARGPASLDVLNWFRVARQEYPGRGMQAVLPASR